MIIKKVLITQKWIDYIEKRQLTKQYRKAKQKLLNWDYISIDLAIREPKIEKIYYFRINKKYRVFWYIENKIFKVIKIYDHQ